MGLTGLFFWGLLFTPRKYADFYTIAKLFRPQTLARTQYPRDPHTFGARHTQTQTHTPASKPLALIYDY